MIHYYRIESLSSFTYTGTYQIYRMPAQKSNYDLFSIGGRRVLRDFRTFFSRFLFFFLATISNLVKLFIFLLFKVLEQTRKYADKELKDANRFASKERDMNMLQNQIQTYEKELQDTVGKMKLAQIDSEIMKSNQEIKPS